MATLQAFQSLRDLSLVLEREPKVAVTLGIIGLERDGLAVGSHRLIDSTRVTDQLVAQVQPRPRAVGTQRRRRGQKTNGLVILRRLAFSQRDPQVVVDPEVCRESLLGPSQQRQGSRTGPSLYQTLFQHVQGFRRFVRDINLPLDDAGQVVEQDRAQPGDPFSMAFAAEVLEVAAGIEECLLEQIRGIEAALEPEANLRPGQQGKVGAIQLQYSAQGLRAPPRASARSCSGSKLPLAFMRSSAAELDLQSETAKTLL